LKTDEGDENPHTSFTALNDADGNRTITDDHEVEVILRKDFFELVLRGMGLKKYIEVPMESQKLETLLKSIGAMAVHEGSQ